MSLETSAKFGEGGIGRLSGADSQFLGYVQELIRATMAGRVPFNLAMTNLLQDLKEIRKNDWDVNAVIGASKFSAVRAATLPEGPSRATPLPGERELLEDFSGLIEFAVRNGISVPSLLASLTHDLVELTTYGWNLDAAEADGYRPKAAGWAKLNREPAEEIADVSE